MTEAEILHARIEAVKITAEHFKCGTLVNVIMAASLVAEFLISGAVPKDEGDRK